MSFSHHAVTRPLAATAETSRMTIAVLPQETLLAEIIASLKKQIAATMPSSVSLLWRGELEALLLEPLLTWGSTAKFAAMSSALGFAARTLAAYPSKAVVDFTRAAPMIDALATETATGESPRGALTISNLAAVLENLAKGDALTLVAATTGTPVGRADREVFSSWISAFLQFATHGALNKTPLRHKEIPATSAWINDLSRLANGALREAAADPSASIPSPALTTELLGSLIGALSYLGLYRDYDLLKYKGSRTAPAYVSAVVARLRDYSRVFASIAYAQSALRLAALEHQLDIVEAVASLICPISEDIAQRKREAVAAARSASALLCSGPRDWMTESLDNLARMAGVDRVYVNGPTTQGELGLSLLKGPGALDSWFELTASETRTIKPASADRVIDYEETVIGNPTAARMWGLGEIASARSAMGSLIDDLLAESATLLYALEHLTATSSSVDMPDPLPLDGPEVLAPRLRVISDLADFSTGVDAWLVDPSGRRRNTLLPYRTRIMPYVATLLAQEQARTVLPVLGHSKPTAVSGLPLSLNTLPIPTCFLQSENPAIFSPTTEEMTIIAGDAVHSGLDYVSTIRLHLVASPAATVALALTQLAGAFLVLLADDRSEAITAIGDKVATVALPGTGYVAAVPKPGENDACRFPVYGARLEDLVAALVPKITKPVIKTTALRDYSGRDDLILLPLPKVPGPSSSENDVYWTYHTTGPTSSGLFAHSRRLEAPTPEGRVAAIKAALVPAVWTRELACAHHFSWDRRASFPVTPLLRHYDIKASGRVYVYYPEIFTQPTGEAFSTPPSAWRRHAVPAAAALPPTFASTDTPPLPEVSLPLPPPQVSLVAQEEPSVTPQPAEHLHASFAPPPAEVPGSEVK